MPDENSKLGKMSRFFKTHFGGKKTKEGQSANKPPKAKNKEESSKSSVKKTFKNAVSKVTNPIMKQLLKPTTQENFEKSLSKIGNTRIKMMSSVHAAILYVKFLQLYDSENTSKVVMKGTPQGATSDIQRITNSVAETDGFKNPNAKEPTHEKLFALSKRIKRITPSIWKGLIKIIDNSFDKGTDDIVDLASTKSNMSDAQIEDVIEQMASDTAPQEDNVKAAKPTAQETKKVKPSGALILSQILSSILTLQKAINSQNQLEIFSKKTARINNIYSRLKSEAGNNDQKTSGLIKSIATILKVLNNEKVDNNEKNNCISYFGDLKAKNPAEVKLGKEISVNLKMFFARFEYTKMKSKLKQTSREKTKIR